MSWLATTRRQWLGSAKKSARRGARLELEELENRIVPAAELKGIYLQAPDGQWGQTVTVTSRIKNAGDSKAGPFQVQYYLSRDGVGSGDDLLLTDINGDPSFYHSKIKAKSKGAYFTVDLQLPGALPNGWSGTGFQIIMKTDAANQVREKKEYNNFGQMGPAYDRDYLSLTAPAPDSPTLTGPSGTTTDTTPTFTWTAVAGAVRYELWVDSLTTGQTQVIWRNDLTGTSFTPSNPLAAGDYRAWVLTSNAAGQFSDWSAALDFTVSPSVPAKPTVTGPSGTTTDTTPTFTWTAVGGATRYELWVDNLTTGQEQVVWRDDITGTSFTPAPTLAAGNYRSWVRAFNGSGQAGDWSDGLDFTVAPPVQIDLGPYTVNAPDSAEVGSTIAVWTDIDNKGTAPSGGFNVRYYLSSDTDINPGDYLLAEVTRASIAGGSYQQWNESIVLPANLAAGIYYVGVMVDPTDAVAETDESNNILADANTISITVTALGKPTVTGPSGTTTATTPTFTWTAVGGATRYELWVDNLTTGQKQVVWRDDITGTSFTPAPTLAAGNYRSWVRAFNGSGQAGDWSDGLDFTVVEPVSENVFRLHSLAGATKRIYLDFDGQWTTDANWNNGETFYTPAFDQDGDTGSFSTEEQALIRAIWERVAEDFRPFAVDVTTEDPGVEALRKTGGGDTEWGIRVLIGGDGSWAGTAPGYGGVGAFNWSTDTPVVVFEDDLTFNVEKSLAEIISHEVGHSLGLDHDGRTNPQEEYYAGNGTGETSWAPIMGNNYTSNLTQWSKGEYANASNGQDDLSIITTQNGFGYRADDHGNSTGSASGLTLESSSRLTGSGIIEKNTDVDFFKFTVTGTGTVTLTVDPFYRGPNLDVMAELYNSTGAWLATANPADQLNATITRTLSAGNYYLKVDGVGTGDPLGTGYSDYGSLGFFSVVVTASGGAGFTASAGGAASAGAGDNSEADDDSEEPAFEGEVAGDSLPAGPVHNCCCCGCCRAGFAANEQLAANEAEAGLAATDGSDEPAGEDLELAKAESGTDGETLVDELDRFFAELGDNSPV